MKGDIGEQRKDLEGPIKYKGKERGQRWEGVSSENLKKMWPWGRNRTAGRQDMPEKNLKNTEKTRGKTKRQGQRRRRRRRTSNNNIHQKPLRQKFRTMIPCLNQPQLNHIPTWHRSNDTHKIMFIKSGLRKASRSNLLRTSYKLITLLYIYIYKD